MKNISAGMHMVILFTVMPGLLGLALWLLGVPLNWSSWKTYVGLVALVSAFKIL
jgi:hypothetical protein